MDGSEAPIGAATARTREKMRPRAGGGKLKHAPPMRVNDLPVAAQAFPNPAKPEPNRKTISPERRKRKLGLLCA